jgi:hypothetical protein
MFTLGGSTPSLRLAVDAAPVYGLAQYQSGRPLLRALSIRNPGKIATEPLRFALTLGDTRLGAEVDVPAIEPGGAHRISLRFTADPTLRALLSRRLRPVTMALRVMHGDRVLAERGVELHEPWRFSHRPELRPWVAAFVTRSVEVLHAVAPIRERMHLEGLDPRDETHARRVATDLYAEIQRRYRIRYEDPEAFRRGADANGSQRVRPAHQVIPAGPEAIGIGTCLDLTLTLAACLRSVGLRPLVLFSGDPLEAPAHAFLGCWLRADVPAAGLLRHEDVKAAVEGGSLLALEATGLCRLGTATVLDVQGAIARGTSLVSGDAVHAIDVRAMQRPAGSVEPLEPGLGPVYETAVYEATEFCARMGLPNVEATHLLYGFAVTGDETLEDALAAVGSSAVRLREVIERGTRKGRHSSRPVPTANCQNVEHAARAVARDRGGAGDEIRATDLVWAFLESRSTTLPEAMKAAGVSPAALRVEMQRRAPRQLPQTEARSQATWRAVE